MNLCIACGDTAGPLEPFWKVLKRCRRCGHCVADLDPHALDFGSIYNEGYFCGAEYVDYFRDRTPFQRQFRARLQEIRRYCPGGDLIEVGCAYGFFLEQAREHFRVRGFDIAEVPVRYAREHLGLDARYEVFKAGSVESASADVAVLWDTLEHLPRPDLTLEAVAGALRPGGYLFLTTGDISSWMARFRRHKWRLIHPPTHLHYFSRRTLRLLLERTGLSLVKLRYTAVWRSMRQILYSLLVLGRSRPSSLYELLSRWPLADWSIAVNTFDIMLAVARKPRGIIPP